MLGSHLVMVSCQEAEEMSVEAAERHDREPV
jgi:hypothetical protein